MRLKKFLILAMSVNGLISSAQNVGISNLYPTEKLHIDSGAIKIGVDFWDSTKSHLLKFGDGNYVIIGENNDDDRMELKAKNFIFSPSATILGYTGNVGIGITAAPTAKLEVAGQVKITGGTPGINKVLTSDANGLATWQTPTINTVGLGLGITGTTIFNAGDISNTNELQTLSLTGSTLSLSNGGGSVTLPNSGSSQWTTTGTNITNNTTGFVGIGSGITPAYQLDIKGRMRIRHNGNTAGLWMNKVDNTEAAFAGMFNDTIYGLYGANSGWTLAQDVQNGRIGIGEFSPTNPLSFASTLGKKISLYHGATGDVGMAVEGNELRMYSDNSNADITFGYDNYGSTGFVERMRIKANGNVGINANPSDYTMHVKNLFFGSNSLLLENGSNLFNNSENKITFKSNNYYTGAIRAKGVSASEASLQFFTGSNASESSLKQRMSINNLGEVTIGPAEGIVAGGKLNIVDTTTGIGETLIELVNFNGYPSGQNTYVQIGKTQLYGPNHNGTGISAEAVYLPTVYGVRGFGIAAPGGNSYGVYGATFSGGATNYAGYFQGNLNYTGTLTNTSDSNLKTNIQPFQNALGYINKIGIKKYEYNAESQRQMNTASGEHIGLLAQELQQILPTLVSKQIQPIFTRVKTKEGIEKSEQTGAKEYLGVNYMELIPILIKGMQEQQEQIEAKDKANENLTKKLIELEERLNKLER